MKMPCCKITEKKLKGNCKETENKLKRIGHVARQLKGNCKETEKYATEKQLKSN